MIRPATVILVLFLLLGALPAAAQDGCRPLQGCVEVAAARPGLTAEEIAAYEAPYFAQITVDNRLLHDRRYQRLTGHVEIYDAPGGSVIRSLHDGFNFVTTIGAVEGWYEINPGEWVRADQAADTNHVVSSFTGIFLPDPLPRYPVAWVVKNVYLSTEPGGASLETNRLVYRYDRLTLYAETEIDGWTWYQVGPDEWIEQTHIARPTPLDRPAEIDTDRWVSIDLYEQTLVAYEGDTPIFATLIATGLPRWPTEEGLFHIYYRRTREAMSWGTPGDDFYALEEVPWTMYFDEGRALHGAYWHNGFGFRRSHGCVNLTITDAHWLYKWVAQDFETLNSPDVEHGPAVYVYSSGVYR